MLSVFWGLIPAAKNPHSCAHFGKILSFCKILGKEITKLEKIFDGFFA
jgi:hypothetical protein